MGYSPKLTAELCQSCYRLKHYGDVISVNKIKVDSDTVLSKLKAMDALFVWVVDLFYLNESMVEGVSRHLLGKDIYLVGTKRDLLPKTVSDHKINTQINTFLKEAQVEVVGMSYVGNHGSKGQQALLNDLKDKSLKRDIVFFGMTNVGKSTLVNSLSETGIISTSYLPGTTLDMLVTETSIGTIIDSPGIQDHDLWIENLDNETLKILQPQRPIKPVNYQLNENQSIIIGGLGIVSFLGAKDLSVTCYFPEGVKVHRTKYDNAAAQLNRIMESDNLKVENEPMILKSHKVRNIKFDCVIEHVGFVCISGEVNEVSTLFPKSLNIVTRKAYI